VRARARETREAELPGRFHRDIHSRIQRRPRAAQGERERQTAVLCWPEQMPPARVPRCTGKPEIGVVGLGSALLVIIAGLGPVPRSDNIVVSPTPPEHLLAVNVEMRFPPSEPPKANLANFQSRRSPSTPCGTTLHRVLCLQRVPFHRFDRRPPIPRCSQCTGTGRIPCSQCSGSGHQASDPAKACLQCRGGGTQKCSQCSGSGRR